MHLTVAYFALFFLIFKCCYTQEPYKKICVVGYELSFFNDKKINKNARKACKDYEGSRLVKVDNQKITEAIDSVIKIDKMMSSIDGAADSNRNWTWEDGDKIYMRDETGYQNWKDNQPNDYGGNEDCIVVGRGTKKWVDNRCNEPLGYICQKNVDPCIRIDSFSNIHKCIAIGSSATEVEWKKGNTEVATNVDQTIYQTKSSEESILHFENASIGDAGNYTCAAWIGTNDNERFSGPVIIKNVSGKPLITKIESFPCNSSLYIYWKPNSRAIGFPHRITAFNSTETVFDISVTPTTRVEQLTEIVGLQSETEYNIEISACQKKGACNAHNSVTIRKATNGSNRIVTNVTLLQLNEQTCTVSWNWPYDIIENIVAKFEINVNNETFFVNISERVYSFEPMQSKSYEVKVQFVESVKACGYAKAVGFCTREEIEKATDVLMTIIIAVSIVIFVVIVVILAVIFIKRKKSNLTETSRNMNPTQPNINVLNHIEESVEYYNVHEYSEIDNVGISGVAQANVDVVYQNCAQHDTAATVYLN